MELKRYPNPVLGEEAKEVTSFNLDLEEKVEEMFEILEKQGGVGLAATQVGLLESFFVIKLNEKKYTFINPIIEEASGEQRFLEGCLSFPGVMFEVTRPARLKMKYQDLEGDEQTLDTEKENILAQIIQHELDHLYGRTFIEYMTELDRNKNKKSFRLLEKLYKKEERQKRLKNKPKVKVKVKKH